MNYRKDLCIRCTHVTYKLHSLLSSMISGKKRTRKCTLVRKGRWLFADVNNTLDKIWVFAATLISQSTLKIPSQGFSLINFPIPCDLQQLSSLLKPTVEGKRRNLNENRRRRMIQNVCLVPRQSINEGSLDTRTWKRLLSRALISCFSRPMEAINRRKTCC